MGDKNVLEHTLEELQEELNVLTKELESYPPGRLKVYPYKNYFKFSLEQETAHGVERKNLKKSERPLVRELLKKEWVMEQSQDLRRKRDSIELYLRQTRSIRKRDIAQSDARKHAAQELFGMEFPEMRAIRWAEEDFPTNTQNPEDRRIPIANGQRVRSKSEQLIADSLRANQIPFRYECGLELGSSTIFPDFTIMHPRTGKIFIWEHFGMIGDLNYRKNTFKKLDRYWSFGYFPSDNLIMTFEDQNHALTPRTVNAIINEYFLLV